jgi:DNA-binding response OmpR family regulator
MSTRPHILMVDDEAAIRQLYTLYFDTHGFQVTTAASSADALHEVYSKKFDVVILDIGLAESNGMDLIEPIKAAQPNVPIFIFTGRTVDQRLREDTRRRGVFQVLTKSHPLDYLVSEIRRAIRTSQAAATGAT